MDRKTAALAILLVGVSARTVSAEPPARGSAYHVGMQATGAPTARPMFAARRGGALPWPENSLLAYRNATGQIPTLGRRLC